ncbi:MAG: acetylornithine deacetylase/succinyl-diaminopimelate desuccinylase family protein [Gemmatimonadetes bacterium]|nr:acetylornithine deacetylase/succinyl-diaminopimelate desuccinylase family protein [Gemmatimonadota bacterium]
MPNARDTALRLVAEARDELVELTRDLVRFPTVNPPGEAYEPCARFLGERLARGGFAVEYFEATGRAEHTRAHPRVNVVARRVVDPSRPTIHLNGHIDVVPVGTGWTLDPFAATVRDGRIYGRGTADMKGGLAAAIIAAECLLRVPNAPIGTIEISGTVDEETGGLAGVAHLAEIGRLTSRSIHHVIIPEPLQVDRVCIGHRGVWWFDLVTTGRIAHGSMPFLGVSAIEHMGEILHELREGLLPELTRRVTAMPVVPEASRRATLNVNTIEGGQVGEAVQSPCVAHECRAIFDRRFLVEEPIEAVRAEIDAVIERVRRRVPGLDLTIADRLLVHPMETPRGSPLVAALSSAIGDVLGREATLVASPGTYDHKHFTRIGGITNCVAYGPGVLEISHQPDEWVGIDELVQAAQVMAAAMLELSHG